MTNRDYPPSLSRIPGKSDSQLQEEKILRQLSGAIDDLPGQSDDFDPEEAAQDLYSTFRMVKLFSDQKRKRGYASPTSVAKQLRQIEAGSGTLEKRLAAADKNVFDAMCDASEDRELAKEEWLQLRSLLTTIRHRAKRAAHTAEAVLN